MYITSGGLVGINTANPTTQLEVNGTISATNFVGDGSGLTGVTAGATDRIVSGSTGQTSMVAISATGYISVTQAGANSAWFDPQRGLVTLGVSSTGPISGTLGRLTRLDIVSTSHAQIVLRQEGLGPDEKQWKFHTDPGAPLLVGTLTNDADTRAAHWLYVRRGGSSPTYVLLMPTHASGAQHARVGIGTLSGVTPTATLQVSGTISATDAIQVGGSALECTAPLAGALRYAGGSIEYCNGVAWSALVGAGGVLGDRIVSGTTNAIAWQDRSLTISTAGTQRVVVGDNGNVGFETDSPKNRIHIHQAGPGYANLQFTNSDTGADDAITGVRVGIASTEDAVFYAGKDTRDLVLGTSNTARFWVTRNGNVGVGISESTATFQVSGTFTVSTSAQLASSPSLHVGPGGNVGIGRIADAALYRFDVAGATRITGGAPWLTFNELDTGVSWTLVQDSGNIGFRYQHTGNLPVLSLSSGSVVVGGYSSNASSITVIGGEIQPSSSGKACVSAVNGGAIRYAAGNLQYCNASNAWVTVGSAGAATAASSTGAVQFNAGGALAGDTDNFYWDNANKRLGIGTATPTQAITLVSGSSKLAINLRTGASAAGAIGVLSSEPFDIYGGGKRLIRLHGDQAVGIGEGIVTPTATLQVSGSFVVSNSAQAATPSLYVAGSGPVRVGMGTSTPQSMLHIFGEWPAISVASEGQQTTGQATVNLLTLATASDSLGQAGTKGWSIYARGDAYSGANSANDFGIGYFDGSTWLAPLSIDSVTGGVGIGTYLPTAKLEVVGTISASDAIQVGSSSLACSSGIPGAIRYNGGNLQYCNGAAWTTLGAGGGGAPIDRIVSGTTNAIAWQDRSLTISTAGAQRMVVGENGNVGIGTATPVNYGAGYRSVEIAPGTVGGLLRVGSAGAASGEFFSDQFAAYLRANGTNVPLDIQTSGTTRIRIDAKGSVGISNATPLAKLDVGGTISASDAIQVGTSSLTCGAGIPGAIRYNGGNLQYCNGAAWTTVGAGGGGGLDDRIISGTLAMTANSATSYVSLSTAGTTWGYFNSGASFLPYFHANRIGVGTMSPGSELHVSGTGQIRVGGLHPRITFEPTDYGTLNLWNIDNWGGPPGWHAQGSLRFYTENYTSSSTGTSGTVHMVITSATQVGIGVHQPSATLHVGGSIWASGRVQVGTTNASCTSGISGSIRYSSISSTLEYCQGTAWVDVGSTGTAYMLRSNANQSGIGTGDVLQFSNVHSSHGTDITGSGNQITVAPGAYKLEASVRVHSSGGAILDYHIYDVTNGAWVGTVGTGEVTSAYSDAPAIAMVSPMVSTTYEVRAIGVANSPDIIGGYGGFSAIKLGGGGSGGGGGSDNLGNHTATQALDMGGYNINNAGTIYGTGAALGGLTVTGASSLTTISTSLVQVGTGLGAACTSSISGSIRYSTVSSTMEYCQGTAWVSMGPSATSVPAFSVHKNGTNQTVGNGVHTKLTFSTEELDTYNNFDTGTSRFTPTVGGLYLLTASSYCNDNATYCQIWIYKNGSPVMSSVTRTSQESVQATAVVSLNGTTDYAEVYVQNGGGTTISGHFQNTRFAGTLIASGNGLGGSGGGSDNLGNHTATQALDMGGFAINNAGTVSASMLQVGNTGAACTAGVSGSIRYSSISSTLEYCNSTAWVSMGPSDTVVPSFAAINSGGQTVANSTVTAVAFDTERFDTNNNFSGNVFTVTVPGTYVFTGSVRYENTSSPYRAYTMIRKNGSAIVSTQMHTSSIGGHFTHVPVTVVDRASVGDEYELVAQQISGGTINLPSNSNYFSGSLIAMAGGSGGDGSDNLGNHIAEQNLQMGVHNIVGTGVVSVTNVSTTIMHVRGTLRSPSITTTAAVGPGSDRIVSGSTFAYVASNGGFVVSNSNPSVWLHAPAPGAQARMVVGGGRTSNGWSHIDLVGDTTYSTYGLQIVRGNTGPNASSAVYHRGTGGLYLFAVDAGHIQLGTDNTGRLTIGSSGNIRFDAYGAGTLTTNSTGDITASSDERLKDIQGAYTRGLEDIQKLHPITYRWTKKSGFDDGHSYSGFGAQDVRKAIPEAVSEGKDGYLTLSDRPILAASVNAIKELKAANDILQNGLKAANDNDQLLRAEIDALRRELRELKKANRR